METLALHNAICRCARSQLTAEKRRLSPAKPLEIPSTRILYMNERARWRAVVTLITSYSWMRLYYICVCVPAFVIFFACA